MSEPVPAEVNRSSRARSFARLGSTSLAVGLIVLWGVWWVRSVQAHHLLLGNWTWTMVEATLSEDFHQHIEHTARVLASGRSIESETDIYCQTFPYPLMIPRLFRWVSWMGSKTAIAVWTFALAVIFLISGLAVSRSRVRLGLRPIPLPWVLVLVLYATPTITAMERGQCDPLTILFLIGAGVLLRARRQERLCDSAAGGLLGLAAWIKFYPGLVIVGLLGLKRWRAAVAFLVVAGSIGIMDFHSTLRAISNGRAIAARSDNVQDWMHPVQHSLSIYWPCFWSTTPLRALASLPGPAVSVLLLAPIIAMVSWSVWRLGRTSGSLLAFPLFLWLIAAGTFALPYSNDYNLVFLPLAVLAVQDRKDPLWTAMALGVFAIYWQPMSCYVEPRVLFLGKLLTLYGTGWCLRDRAIELLGASDETVVSAPSSAVPASHLAVPALQDARTRPVPSSPADRGI